MASIRTAQAQIKAGIAAAERGDSLAAARAGLAAMQQAVRCVAAGRDEAALSGHDLATGRAQRVLDDETASPATRAEAGRIKAEAAYLLRRVA